MEKREPDPQRLEFVRWLAECQRNNSIAVEKSFRIDPGWLQAEGLKRHAQNWSYHEIRLDYEPRSLAVAPWGGRVAVGTKAGQILIARWYGEAWQEAVVPSEMLWDGTNGKPKGSPSAIRGLLLLDEHTLVAGWGWGGYSIVEVLPQGETRVTNLAQENFDHEDWQLSTRRFTRLIHLFDPLGEVPAEGDLVLGITRRGDLYVLERTAAGDYKSERRKPEKVFPNWDPVQGRIVDGVWIHGYLWLLTSQGHLLQLDRNLAFKGSARIDRPKRDAVFRRLAACEAGLAVLAAESVTFQWFYWEPDRDYPMIDAGVPRWYHIPGAMDFSACLPYPAPGYPSQVYPEWGRGRNPVWVVVSTAEPGLRWISWSRPEPPESARSPEADGWPTAAAASFTVVEGGRVLYVGVGRSIPATLAGPHSTPFLVCGTRDQRLVLASVLDRDTCGAELKRQMEWLSGQEGEGRDRLWAKEDGVRWWRLLRRIQDDFGLLKDGLGDAERERDPADLLDCTDKGNLRHLAAYLVRCRNQPRREADADSVLARWMLRLLRRANELGPEVDLEIGRLLYVSLQRGAEEHEDDRLGALAGFVRKWVVHGGTYADKKSNLLEIYEWNRGCGRNLDALVYLTRLLRQRTDHRWEAVPPTGPWTPTVWSLATTRKEELTFASLGDGALCAITKDGKVVPWQGDDVKLSERHLVRTAGGLRLERSDARAFEEKYQHGPYARSLWLAPLSAEGGDYLLAFCLKGWRRQDREHEHELGPIVYAVRLRPVTGEGGEIGGVEIVAIAGAEVFNELYSLCEIESSGEGTDRRFLLVAGTSGSWVPPGRRGEAGLWEPSPFIEVEIGMQGGDLSIEDRPVEIDRFKESERSVFRQTTVVPESAYNPCWVIVRSEVERESGGPPETWVWAGFQDGNIRGYHLERGAARKWIEGGGPTPSRRGLQVTGAVWRLHAFAGQDGRPMLAYGTGDGVIGAVFLDDLKRKSQSEPVRFLIHSREGSPISGLMDFEDWEDGKLLPYLMSVTQEGVVSIFSLDYHRWRSTEIEPSRQGLRFHYPGLQVDRFRVACATRVAAWIGPRRGADAAASGRRPHFLLGSENGRIHRHQLELPMYSQRRRQQVPILEKLMDNAEKGRSVKLIVPRETGLPASGSDEAARIHKWLRVLHTGDALLRFSIWYELRQAGRFLDEIGDEEEFAKGFDCYVSTVRRLAAEIYRRRPFSKEPAKMIWHEGGRIATEIALAAICRSPAAGTAPDPRLQQLLAQYCDLNILLSDLCNRWIGVGQLLESTVLIHSFKHMFDWTAIVLLATEQQPRKVANDVRRMLVYTLIQRRLNFTDYVVPLETMRVINAAILRAIANNRKGGEAGIEPRRFVIVPEGGQDAGNGHPTGFFDLMTMVGDLWERLSDSLSLADPLLSEIVRFFSLSLLLVPESALLTGQVVSESRLTEAGTGLGDLILQEAERLRGELQKQGWKEEKNDSRLLGDGLARYENYIQEKADFTIVDPETGVPGQSRENRGEESSWQYFAREAQNLVREGKDELGHFSDESMLSEQYEVMQAAAWLSDLHRTIVREDGHEGFRELAEWFELEDRYLKGQISRKELEALLPNLPKPLHWLLKPWTTTKFFSHSKKYLRHLAQVRQEVRRLAQLVKGAQEPQGDDAISTIQLAIKLCEKTLSQLQQEYLFRPQRDHYEQVIRRWRDQLVKRAREAITVLDVLDQFNRHVYRTSADILMDKIVNLSMQVAPISYVEKFGNEEWQQTWHQNVDGPLRLLLRRRLRSHPLVQQVFETGERLVESTHLAGTLLTVARDYVGKPGELGRRPPTARIVSMNEISKSMEEAARRMGIRGDGSVWWTGYGLGNRKAPGSPVIWDLIAQEFATNIAKYSQIDPNVPEPERVLMRATVQEDGEGRLCVLIAANVPYLWTVGDEKRKRYEQELPPEEAVKEIDDKLKEFLRARERGHSDDRGGGMGLYMIDKIAEMCDIRAGLRLFDPAEKLSEAARIPPREKLAKHPLCLCLFWEEENGGE